MADQTGRPDRELFQPTVGKEPAYDPLPWNPESSFYVAFFGGIISVTTIAFLNAVRLYAGDVGLRILAIGTVAFALFVAGAYGLETQLEQSESFGEYARIGVRVAGVLLHFVFLAQLKGPWRRYQLLRGGATAPLWGPGLAAVIAGGLAQIAVLSMVADV